MVGATDASFDVCEDDVGPFCTVDRSGCAASAGLENRVRVTGIGEAPKHHQPVGVELFMDSQSPK